MQSAKMAAESELILLIAGRMVSGGNDKGGGINGLVNAPGINWGRFKELIMYHDLTPFAHPLLKDTALKAPQGLRGFLENNYYCALARCQNIWKEFFRILNAFQGAGIVIIPIKGVALLEDLYARFPVRPMTDIDLLVKEEDIPGAEAVFYGLGYRKELYGLKEGYWRENQCHITFYKKEDEKAPFVELHWSLDFKRKNRTVLPELWERTRSINVDGKTIKLLSPEDTLFSLALHNRRFGRTLCLKNAYDSVLLLNKYALNFDWDYVLRQSRKYSICATLFFLLLQAKLLAELNIPEFVWAKLNLSARKRRLIERFIEKNTFLAEKNKQGKSLYLKSHFLLYDTLWESVGYILNIPKEQFAKYYGLKPYAKKTNFFYRNRLFYIPLKTISGVFPTKILCAEDTVVTGRR